MLFYYQIKGKRDDGGWSWPPVASGRIEAADSKQARVLLEEEHGIKLPGGRLKKESEAQHFLLTFEPLVEGGYLWKRFEPMYCKQCGQEYTLNEKYMVNAGGQSDYCSASCTQDFKNEQAIEFNVNFDFNGVYEPVIYKITSKTTGMCYIGKTTQAFTLRWYQHFYQGCGTKFHAAIKQLGVLDWIFEVVEVVELPEKAKHMRTAELQRIMTEREMAYIAYFDSINNGYNTTPSKKEKVEKPQKEELPSLFKQGQ